MKRIVEIVPARPGWYARWRQAPESTCCFPVTLWALLEEADGSGREVVGVDSVGRWPGSDDNGAGVTFVRYLFQQPESGEPEDAFRVGTEPVTRVVSGPPAEPQPV